MKTSKTLEVVRRIVGRKSKITKDEMGAILMGLKEIGLDLRNSYVHDTMDDALRASIAWVKACKGITCISASLSGYLRDGMVRYDQPGSMNPMQHAEVTFMPQSLAERTDHDPVSYMRRHCDRLLIVRDEPEHPAVVAQQEAAKRAAEEAKYTTCECDNGHTWRTEDPDRDWKCPTCGEPWV
jgi:hypothetical protein